MLTTNGDCPVCNAPNGSCNDFAKGLPVQVGLETEVVTRAPAGRFYRTTGRVWSDDGRYLIVGAGQDIAWERAIELGLIPAPPRAAPLTAAPEPAEIEFHEATVEAAEVKPELVSDANTVAAIKRRPKRKTSGKLGGVS